MTTGRERVDWTTTDGCQYCSEHGPYEEWDAKVIASRERARDSHQAWHSLAAAMLPPVVALTRWLDRLLTRR